MIPILLVALAEPVAVLVGDGDDDTMNAPHNSTDVASSSIIETKHLPTTRFLFMLNIFIACFWFC
jgi:hypothetical protein